MPELGRLIETIPVTDTLGEGVAWRDSDHTVWWTDIQARRLHCMTWPGLALTTYETPERLGSFAFIEGDDEDILAAFESGFARFAPRTGAVTWLARPPELGDGVRLNDGRVDPTGRFWAGSMLEPAPGQAMASAGHLYRLERNGRATAILSGVGIANGLAWSPDARRMYFADSARATIYAARFDPVSAAPGRMEAFATLKTGAPDGAVTDAEGQLWSAVWGAGCVTRFAPDGAVTGTLEIPAPQPTCPAFGGANGDVLFVTSARDGLDADTLNAHSASGALFVFETSARGDPRPRRAVLSP